MAIRLRARITIAMLALALVPLAVVTAVLAQLNLSSLTMSAKEYGLSVADHVVDAVRVPVRVATGELTAAGSALTQSEVPIDQRIQVIRSVMLGSEHIDPLVVYNKHGELMDTFRVKEAARTVAPPEALTEAMRTQAQRADVALLPVEVLSGKGAVLPLLKAVRLADGQTVYGYLWAGVDLGELPERLGEMSEQRFDGRVDRVFVFDDQWRVVVHAEPARVGTSLANRGFLEGLPADETENLLNGKATVSADYEVEGEALLGMLRGIPELRWGVLVEQPTSVAYDAVQATLVTALALGAGFVALAFVVGLLMGRGLSAPVLSVARAAVKVQEGDLETTVEAKSRDEVGDMARAFNHMVTGLREREYIRDTFGRYVTPEVAAKLIRDPDSLALGGKIQEVTVVMTDLRGFTAMTERAGPEAMVEMLNRYFTRMCDVVLRYDGHISEFVGDGLVLFFGAPDPRDDDALRAVACAIALQRELRVFAAAEGRSLEMGVGIDTGRVIAGNIGSDKRRKYGVVGDAINLAARLESITVGTQVLLSEATYTHVRAAVEVGPRQLFQAKGKKDPIAYHALTAVGAPFDLRMPETAAEERHPLAAEARCWSIAGKEVAAESRPARTTHASATELVWEADWAPELLGNLKLALTLPDDRVLEDLYVKATAVERAGEGHHRVTARITSAPEDARKILEG